MPDAFTIRRYKPADADDVWTVHERALRASPLEFREDAPDTDLREIADRCLDAGGEFLVGERDGELVATGGFQPGEDDAAELRRMRVHPDHQRRGYGRRLLEALEARARAHGFERIVLDTNEHLRAARALYEAHGYNETRRSIRGSASASGTYRG